jgi:hypothetical protein
MRYLPKQKKGITLCDAELLVEFFIFLLVTSNCFIGTESNLFPMMVFLSCFKYNLYSDTQEFR